MIILIILMILILILIILYSLIAMMVTTVPPQVSLPVSTTSSTTPSPTTEEQWDPNWEQVSKFGRLIFLAQKFGDNGILSALAYYFASKMANGIKFEKLKPRVSSIRRLRSLVRGSG